MCYTLSPSKNMLSSLAALGISPQHLCSSDFPEVTYSAAGLVPLNPALVPTHPSLFFFLPCSIPPTHLTPLKYSFSLLAHHKWLVPS